VWVVDSVYNSMPCMLGQSMLDFAIGYPWFMRLLGCKIGKQVPAAESLIHCVCSILLE